MAVAADTVNVQDLIEAASLGVVLLALPPVLPVVVVIVTAVVGAVDHVPVTRTAVAVTFVVVLPWYAVTCIAVRHRQQRTRTNESGSQANAMHSQSLCTRCGLITCAASAKVAAEATHLHHGSLPKEHRSMQCTAQAVLHEVRNLAGQSHTRTTAATRKGDSNRPVVVNQHNIS